MKFITYILLAVICLGCSPKQEEAKSTECDLCIHTFAPQADENAVCAQGNVQAYERVKAFFQQHGVGREVIFFSIVMANRYHYPPAYFDVYMCLWEAFNGGKKAKLWDMTHFDPKSRDMALFYLREAAASGNKQALEILVKQYE